MRKVRERKLKKVAILCFVSVFVVQGACGVFTDVFASGNNAVDADSLCSVVNDHPLAYDEALSYLFQEFVIKEADSAHLVLADDVDIKQVLWDIKYIDKKDYPYDLQVYWSMTDGYSMVRCDGACIIYPNWKYKSSDAETEIDDIVSCIGTGESRFENFQNIRNYIAHNYSYDVSGENGDFVTATGHTMTCVGYSTLFFLLCDRYGIPCHIINNEIHEWVEVAYISDDLFLEYEPQGKMLASVYLARLSTRLFHSDDGEKYERSAGCDGL